MNKLFVPILALFVSCGNSSVVPNTVVGIWVSNDCPCLISTIFNEDGTYQYSSVCESEDDSDELHEEYVSGTYTVEGEFVTLTENTEQSVSSFRYDFVDNELRIIYPDDVLVFERQGGKNTEISSYKFGCVNEDGSFNVFPVDD